jgi:hypothetical protein
LPRSAVGLAFSFEEYVARHLASGALVRVLEELVACVRGFLLGLPGPASPAGAAVRALIGALRFSDPVSDRKT